MKKSSLKVIFCSLIGLGLVLGLGKPAKEAVAGESVMNCPGECSHVAAIGTTHYEFLEDAIEAAEQGQTVELLCDTTLSRKLEIEKEITLDLGGFTLSSTFYATNAGSFEGGADVTPTICNGTLRSTQSAVTVLCHTGGAVNLVDVSLQHAPFANFISSIYLLGSSASLVSTLSGTVSLDGDIYCSNKNNFKVLEGEYNFDPTSYIDTDHYSLTNVGGVYKVVNIDVFKIGEKFFATFEGAMKNASNGDTIVLLKDFVNSPENSVEIKKNITLDLNAHSMTASAQMAFNVKGGVSAFIKNGTLISGYTNGTCAVLYVSGTGHVELTDVTLKYADGINPSFSLYLNKSGGNSSAVLSGTINFYGQIYNSVNTLTANVGSYNFDPTDLAQSHKVVCDKVNKVWHVLADGIEPYTYVSLGDSMTTGFGFDDYYVDDDSDAKVSGVDYSEQDGHKNVRGFLNKSEKSYPSLVTKYLTEKLSNNYVDWIPLATNSARIDDIYYALTGASGDEFYRDSFVNGYLAERARDKMFTESADNRVALMETYRKSIEKADLITLNAGFNNIGIFVSGKLNQFAENLPISYGYGGSDVIADLIKKSGIDIDYFGVYDAMEAIVENAFGKSVSEISTVKIGDYTFHIDVLLDAITYGFVTYCYYMNETTKLIKEINPDVELVVVGMCNTIRGIQVAGGGLTIDLEKLYNPVFQLANLYAACGTEASASYKYVDIDDVKVTSHVDDVANDTMDVSQKRRLYHALMALKSENIFKAVGIKSFSDVKSAINVAVKNGNDEFAGTADPTFDLASYLSGSGAELVVERAHVTNEQIQDKEALVSAINNRLDAYYDETEALLHVFVRAAKNTNFDVDKVKGLSGEGITKEALLRGDYDPLVNMYFRTILNNGMWGHPNEEGHAATAAAIIKTLESDLSALAYTLSKFTSIEVGTIKMVAPIMSMLFVRLLPEMQSLVKDGVDVLVEKLYEVNDKITELKLMVEEAKVEANKALEEAKVQVELLKEYAKAEVVIAKEKVLEAKALAEQKISEAKEKLALTMVEVKAKATVAIEEMKAEVNTAITEAVETLAEQERFASELLSAALEKAVFEVECAVNEAEKALAEKIAEIDALIPQEVKDFVKFVLDHTQFDEEATEIIVEFVEETKEDVQDIIEIVEEAIEETADFTAEIAGETKEELAEIITEGVKEATPIVEEANNEIADIVEETTGEIVEGESEIANDIATEVGDAAADIVEEATSSVETVEEAAEEAAEEAEEEVEELVEELGSQLVDMWSSFFNFF